LLGRSCLKTLNTLIDGYPHSNLCREQGPGRFKNGDWHFFAGRRKSSEEFLKGLDTLNIVKHRLDENTCSTKDRSATQNAGIFDDGAVLRARGLTPLEAIIIPLLEAPSVQGLLEAAPTTAAKSPAGTSAASEA